MKRITIRFKILALIILLVAIICIVLMVSTHAVQNFFFQMLRPWMIEKVTLCIDSYPTHYAELTDLQVAELVALLNNVRLTGEGVHAVTPSLMNTNGYHIHLITGQTLIFSTQNEMEVAVGSYAFTNAGGNTLDIAKLRIKHLQAHRSFE